MAVENGNRNGFGSILVEGFLGTKKEGGRKEKREKKGKKKERRKEREERKVDLDPFYYSLSTAGVFGGCYEA